MLCMLLETSGVEIENPDSIGHRMSQAVRNTSDKPTRM